MMIFVICLILFIGLMLFPFLLSHKVKYGEKNEMSLVVRSDNVKNPRYFAESFREKMKSFTCDGQESVMGVTLSKEENIIIWNADKYKGKNVNELCYIKDGGTIKESHTFKKEIFAKKDIEFAEKTTMRAVAGEQNICIRQNSKIVRWADAKNILIIGENSDAGMSISAGSHLIIEENCEFMRIYAPVIEFRKAGTLEEEKEQTKVLPIYAGTDAPVYMKLLRDIKEVEQGIELRKTIVTKHNLLIHAGTVIYGDVKSDKNITIDSGAVITGNVFADKNITIKRGVKIFGDVFAGQNLYIGTDTEIGKPGRIKSAVSRLSMTVEQGVTVYGYIGAEEKGKTKAAEELGEITRPKQEFPVLAFELDDAGCIFIEAEKIDGIEDDNNSKDIDYYGFRNNDRIKGVKMQEGIKHIIPSMFYGCKNLEKIRIPDTVEEIGEYAFFGCEKLKEVEISDKSCLKEVGDFAFSECGMLKELNLAHIEKIGTAAFRNDYSLENTAGVLRENVEIGSHAFQNCEKIIFKNKIEGKR